MKLEEAEKIFNAVREYGDDFAISESIMLEAYDTIIAARDERIAELERERDMYKLWWIGRTEFADKTLYERDEARKNAVEIADMLKDCIENSEDSESYLSRKYRKYATTVIKEYR